MHKISCIIVFVLCSLNVALGQDDAFYKMIDTLTQQTVPTIVPKELFKNYDNYTILDTRELKEYKTSHLKNANYVGYSSFKLKKTISKLDKSKPVLVYCTVGYRSEKIGEKLQKKGFKVYNLYGGIVNWKNKYFSVVNSENQNTENVHCFDKDWSKWLQNGTKVYD